MKRTAILFTVLCFLAVTGLAQDAPKKSAPKAPAVGKAVTNAAGEWDATTKMPTGNVTEHWVVKQTGTKVSGTVKAADGKEYPITGEMVPPGYFFRVAVTFPDGDHLIRATVETDSMDGSITIGRMEYLFAAKRTK